MKDQEPAQNQVLKSAWIAQRCNWKCGQKIENRKLFSNFWNENIPTLRRRA